MSFKGKSIHAINESGRISIPSRLRDELKSCYESEKLVIACLSNFIAAFPVKEWEKFEEKLHAQPPSTVQDADSLRRIYESLEDVSIDKNGRILISIANREKAGLKDECVILGLYDRIEIWSREVWDSRQNEASSQSSDTRFNLLMF